ncbi:MAG: DUF45 domain-containing protein [Clostridia bacterium]|nr:DUF45 domain-containing protein [Clostridia bacterium]
MKINVLKSIRKTTVIKIENNGEVTVKAPVFLSDNKIFEFLNLKRAWINEKIAEINAQNAKNESILTKKTAYFNGNEVIYSKNYYKDLKSLAKRYLVERANFLARYYGFTINQIKIRKYKSRWGSCDKNKNVTLNVMLMALDNKLIDYVIIHELCHTVHFNHKQDFHKMLKSLIKNANELNKRLKQMSYLTKIDYK